MAADIGNIYTHLKPLLTAVAVGKFGMDRDTAADLLHDIFITFISRQATIHDPQAYLVAAMSQACRRYRSGTGRWEGTGDLEPLVDVQDSLDAKLTVRSILEKITPGQRAALEMRYLEGHSVSSVGRRLGVTEKYASNLIARAKREAAQCA